MLCALHSYTCILFFHACSTEASSWPFVYATYVIRVTWRHGVWVKINVNYLQINISGIKRRYSVFLELAYNLLATNQEKTSLMQDLIIDLADDTCSRENEIYIWVSLA